MINQRFEAGEQNIFVRIVCSLEWLANWRGKLSDTFMQYTSRYKEMLSNSL